MDTPRRTTAGPHDTTGPALVGDPPRRPRVLIAPVTVTPTKALGLSHVKGLLWVDVMYRATRLLADADYLYSHTAFNITRQTAGFWEYLDRGCPDIDPSRCAEDDVGRLYTAFQAQPSPPPDEALQPYVRAVEEIGWTHPVSRRVLEIWHGHYDWLGLYDPGITRTTPPRMGLEEVVEYLAKRGLCLDARRDGGPVYLDATAQGLPLRPVTSAGGHPNYLGCALRDLVPMLERYDEIVLVHDRELTEDYILLQKIFGALGAETHRICLSRVPLDGIVRSSRHGVDHRHTVAGLADELGDYGTAEAVRLGMRLYFIAGLGKGSGQSFRMDLLREFIDRAGKLLARDDAPDAPDMEAFLRRNTGGRAFVDAYRLTSALLGRHRRVPLRALTSSVYG
ncbi:hypothetical protein [Streptomyces niphimycinicus]|uniref:hypothetical protein n=1 Tax=Streptomyces niphimycinicus TaxID=2842201 RepID=UPI00209B2EB6|nr:hypothetical protein [Streptomyces niphimycinicus]